MFKNPGSQRHSLKLWQKQTKHVILSEIFTLDPALIYSYVHKFDSLYILEANE